MIGRLHILTDTVLQHRYSHYQLAEMAIAGGADAIQYRNKLELTASDFAELQAIRLLTRTHGVTFIINDSIDAAIACNADGCHVGATDTDPITTRMRLLAGGILEPIVGVTIHTLDELHALPSTGIDYIGSGPVFGTSSKKTGLPPLGLEKLSEICKLSSFPVIAIGNIKPENIQATLATGARGIAVLGAVCLAENPEASTHAFASQIF